MTPLEARWALKDSAFSLPTKLGSHTSPYSLLLKLSHRALVLRGAEEANVGILSHCWAGDQGALGEV